MPTHYYQHGDIISISGKTDCSLQQKNEHIKKAESSNRFFKK